MSQDTITLTSRRQIRLDKLAMLCGSSLPSSAPSASTAGHGEAVGPAPGSDTISGNDSEVVRRLRPLSWRLDKDEASSTFNLMRSNLLALMAPSGPAVRLRQLLVDLEPPLVGGVNATAAVRRGEGDMRERSTGQRNSSVKEGGRGT